MTEETLENKTYAYTSCLSESSYLFLKHFLLARNLPYGREFGLYTKDMDLILRFTVHRNHVIRMNEFICKCAYELREYRDTVCTLHIPDLNVELVLNCDAPTQCIYCEKIYKNVILFVNCKQTNN